MQLIWSLVCHQINVQSTQGIIDFLNKQLHWEFKGPKIYDLTTDKNVLNFNANNNKYKNKYSTA